VFVESNRLAYQRKRVAYGLALAGLITLLVAFIRTTILSTDAWLITVLWVGGAIMVLLAIVLAAGFRKGSKA
jgi:hypothetical protein